MNLLQDLLEALKPSEYRKYVKGWNKTKYDAMFRKYAQDRKAYRIYIPLKGDPRNVEPDPEVKAAVEAAGYVIEDYVTGIASKDDGKRKIKIGKLLKDQKLQQKFANDPKRASSKNIENFVVISRHPYDIAGMSTDRGWRSCMNIHDGINKHYVPVDIKEGSLVAYLVRADDKNINNPIARVLIKTFINVDGNAPEDKRVAFGVEDRVYGTALAGFRETVLKWVEEVNDSRGLDGIFEFNDNLYNDGGTKGKIGVGPSGKLFQMVKDDWKNISKIDNPSKEILDLAMAESNGAAVMYLKNPSLHDVEEAFKNVYYSYYGKNEYVKDMIKRAQEIKLWTPTVKKILLERYPKAIALIPDATDQDLMDAIENDFEIFTEIENPSDDVIRFTIKNYPREVFRYIKDPSDELVILALDAAKEWGEKYHVTPAEAVGEVLNKIKTPSKEVIHHAIDIDHRAIKYIDEDHIHDDHAQKAYAKDTRFFRYLKNPTEEQIDKAIEESPSNIQYVKNPTTEQMLKAVKEDGMVLGMLEGDIPREVYEAAIEENHAAIRYVPEEHHDEALHHKFLDGNDKKNEFNHAIGSSYIKNPTHAVMLRAVKQNPRWISQFKNPPEDVQREAIKKNYRLIMNINNPSEAIQLEVINALKKDQEEILYDISGLTKTVVMAAVKKFGGKVLNYLRDDDYDEDLGEYKNNAVDDEVAREALKTFPRAIQYIKDVTVDDIEQALKKDPTALRHLKASHRKNMSREQKIRLLKKDGSLLDYLPDEDLRDDEFLTIAIKNSPYTVEYAYYSESDDNDPIPEKYQLLAIKNKKVGPKEKFRVDMVLSRIGWKSIVPSASKIAVEKDHMSFAEVKRFVAKMTAKEKVRRGFTKEFMEELKKIAAGGKAKHDEVIKKHKMIASAIRNRSWIERAQKKAVDSAAKFITGNPANTKAKSSYDDYESSLIRRFGLTMLEMDHLFDSVKLLSNVFAKIDGFDARAEFAIFMMKKEPVAWFNYSSKSKDAFVPGIKTKIMKLDESGSVTFKGMILEAPSEDEAE